MVRSAETVQKSEWAPSSAVQRLRTDHQNTPVTLGAERALHYTQFFRSCAKQYPSATIQMARALEYHLDHRTVNLYPDELIVGGHTEHRVAAICHVELAGAFMLEDILKLPKRKINPINVDKKIQRTLLLKVLPYWLNNNLAAKAFSGLDKVRYTLDQLKARNYVINEAGGIAHFLPDYPELLANGTVGLRKKIQEQLRQHKDLDVDQRDFLAAQLVTLEALERFAARYLELARSNQNTELVSVLERVPKNPPETVREALQLIWFFQLVIQVESLDQGISLGRLDQYLYPYYQREVAAGTWDPEQFRNLMCAFSIKLSEVIPLFSERYTHYFSGLPSGQAATVGGISAEGDCAANELTYLLLDVIEHFPMRQPNWHARISKQSSGAYVQRVMEVVAAGSGSPALYNDDVITSAMARRGVHEDIVWDYGTVGCVEPAPAGVSFTSSDAALVNLPIVVERILKKGKCRDILSIEDLFERIESELDVQIKTLKKGLDAIELANRKYHPTPFSSLTVKGCIEQARDLSAGGALYNASGIQGVGLADLANSVAAINSLVFKKELYSLEAIAAACRKNFSGQELLQARLSGVAKFGNDNQDVDLIAGRLVDIFNRVVSQHGNTRGGQWTPGFYSMTCHQTFGAKTAALPSGRPRGGSFADGLAPVDGTDVLGPTASLNSITRIDHHAVGNGLNLNMKFDARVLAGAKGVQLLRALMQAYFANGGMQVQINVLDPDVLLRAQSHPEEYRNLLVRVSGYSAYFVDLTPAMQDELIRRTSQSA